MNLDRTLTATVYIVNKGKVLLHMHKKHKTLFPLGGHMNPEELPHETAIREVYEESGLIIELYNDEEKLQLGKVRQLYRPMNVLLENIGQPIENIDFIYFATTDVDKVHPQDGESKELYWLSKDEIISDENIKPHIKSMALRALEVLYE
ncbi:NUDIX domain-containing protein [Clostridium estertheticum]|uniref:NUDIX domain-containing protein n=1 Tax=Clostridium estertheticum TaxID=238834 RepID=UPI001CF5641D|nr:NUDIX domain-containing protein [Clostridium estertheticum]MCB2305612.1 NUDIX domain-containing protein [Clostridium estertheticum]MCB2344572.1 NUDIX domain-containing protein [Clostridium estertheticum]MCB2347968.1 NUDIX domain-containing protein [Clostridium estertheticum]WAG45612.1 NUDIX domain-containing protein [Clostridium estertheticum]